MFPALSAIILKIYFTSIILYSFSPLGVPAFTLSPAFLPKSTFPIGDSLEIFQISGSASFEPTMVKVCDLPEFSTSTVSPTLTDVLALLLFLH